MSQFHAVFVPSTLKRGYPLCALVLSLILAACSSVPPKPEPPPAPPASTETPTDNGAPGSDRYARQQDTAPSEAAAKAKEVSRLPEPVPKKEPLSPYGNPDTYTVYGVTYHVLSSAKGYDKVGIASWYGAKFHGYRTSSGEPYDMYRFTAAHRTLPLPTYARVTNLENGKSVVVRINDRGPFNPSRIIDLSWAAAVRLDMIKKGTAKVRVEALTAPDKNNQPDTMSTAVRAALDSPPPDHASQQGGHAGLYLQAGAFRGLQHARQLEKQLHEQLKLPVTIRRPDSGSLYRVWLGPFATSQDRTDARNAVSRAGFNEPIPVK